MLRRYSVLLLLAGLMPAAQAAQLTALRCATQSDGGFRVVLEMDARISKPEVTRAGSRDRVIPLSGINQIARTLVSNCASRTAVTVSIERTADKTLQLRLRSKQTLTGKAYNLRPANGRGHRIVFDLDPLTPTYAKVTPPAKPAPVPEPVLKTPASDPINQLPAPAAGSPPTPIALKRPDEAGSPWQMRGFVAAEGRAFFQSAQYGGQKGSGLSLVAEPEFYRTWADDTFSFRPYLRWDQHDGKRTGADIRELIWIHAGDGWELAGGIGKVFWGVTEAYHLVDIINQTDLVANPDGEQKLGQPMLRASLERDWGTMTLFALPGFRERRFPGTPGRFRPALAVEPDATQYRDDRGQWDWDWALRWSHYFGDFDVALSHFYGTGREPTLAPGMYGGQPVMIPTYELINQTSLEAQFTRGDWLWKLEAMRRSGQGDTFWAATGGFEYTLVGIGDTASDLGVLTELMYDSRGSAATTPFNREVFAGLRWTANDVAGTTLLTGLIRDWDNGASAFNLEASRRFGQRWTLQLQARGWFNVPSNDVLAAFQRDDYAELTLFRYF